MLFENVTIFVPCMVTCSTITKLFITCEKVLRINIHSPGTTQSIGVVTPTKTCPINSTICLKEVLIGFT